MTREQLIRHAMKPWKRLALLLGIPVMAASFTFAVALCPDFAAWQFWAALAFIPTLYTILQLTFGRMDARARAEIKADALIQRIERREQADG